MTRVRRVGIILKANPKFSAGVRAYSAEHGQWSILETTRVERPFIEGMARFCDGLIVAARDMRVARVATATGRPCVNVCNSLPNRYFPSVIVDDLQVGRLAASYFLEKGYRNFAFFATMRTPCSLARRNGFGETVCRSGLACHTLWMQSTADIARMNRALARWLMQLPKPLALLAATDSMGTLAINTCRDAGLRVPHEVAVLGVDNAAALCHMTSPPLSSVSLQMGRWGYEAAALLDRLMSGKTAPDKEIVLPPGGVVQRGSTDCLGVEDDLCVRAMQHIRRHACDMLTVARLAAALGASRRCLERRFQQALRTSPHDEIRRVQVERAKHLLADTRLTIAEVARASGIGTPECLWDTFKKQLLISPSEFRSRHMDYVAQTLPAASQAQ